MVAMAMVLNKKCSALAALTLLLWSKTDAFSIGAVSTFRRAAATKLDAKGGIDAYAAQMAAISGGGTPAAADVTTVDKVAAEMLDSSREKSNAVITSSSDAAIVSSADITALQTSQARIMETIKSSIPDLAVKPDLSVSSSGGFTTIAGNTVKLDAYDAPGPANIAWISDLSIDNIMSSLTIFNGPLTNVPHLISRCVVTPNNGGDNTLLHFFLDFRPRAYGAYDLRDASGNFPGPDTLGRKAFEYSGARKDFESKFGTEDVAKFYDDIKSQLDGAVENPGLGDDRLPELEKLTRGPLALDLTMPLSSKNVGIVSSARERAASLWLEWALDSSHRHKPGAPVNSQYVYDSKYKINAYGVLLDVYVNLFGQSEGEKLAAADSGPIDEAYVGGGS